MSEAVSIQLSFPSEPRWSSVSDVALVQLVQTHEDEPSCAQSALVELKARCHPQTEDLCCELLSSEAADKWLRAGALGVLLSINLLRGLDTAMAFIDRCEIELIEEIIEAMNYGNQGELSSAIHRHPIMRGVKERLSQLGSTHAKFGQLFIENFGAW